MPKKAAKKQNRALLKEGLKHIAESTAVVFILLLVGANITHFIRSQKILGASVEAQSDLPPTLEEEKRFWEQIITTHPTYRDAYLELAKISEELGEFEMAEKYELQALQIDPN